MDQFVIFHLVLCTLVPCLLALPQHGAISNQTSTCSMLALKNTSSVVTGKEPLLYTQEREAHWSQTAWKSPACIFTPESVADLQTAMSILVASDQAFAIRGAGHSPLPGWANIDNGVLISTRSIQDVVYDHTTEYVRVGMGRTWGELYSYLEQYGRMVQGGRSPTVGLATIMGGGLSHLSNQYGFVADSVVEFEMIDANGAIIQANAESNTDLFFALKTGAANFGIVTHVTMQTYPLGRVWGGALVYTGDHQDDVMRAISAYQQEGQLDKRSALLSYMGVNNNTLYVILAYLDPVMRPSAFAPFYDIPNIFDGTRMRDNLTDLISDKIDLVVSRWTYGATTLHLDEETYVDVARIAKDVAIEMASINGASMVLMPQPISKSMIDTSVSLGPNPMTASLNHTAQMWLGINIGWNLPCDDDRVDVWMLETIRRIENLTQSRSVFDGFIFLNDAYSTQTPFESFGKETVEMLRKTRRAFDPAGIFQRQVPGGFKLGSG